MKRYYVIFKNQNTPVCGTWILANDPETAQSTAEFKLICMFPNVHYTETEITITEDV